MQEEKACFSCGKKGHIARNCPGKKGDDKTSSNHTSALDEGTVLAMPWVPMEKRRINKIPVGQVLMAAELPSLNMELKSTHMAMVPLHHACVCQGETHNVSASAEVKRLHPELGPPKDPKVYKEDQKRLTAQIVEKAVNHIDSLTDLQDYIASFHKRMQLELWGVIQLYERYSQYSVPIEIKANTRGKIELYGSIRISGIADSRPLLQPGDYALARPLGQIARQYLGYWEIHARVIAVERGKESDQVLITWLDPRTNSWLQKNWLSNALYNVHFVPSTSSWERSYSALQWFSVLPPPLAKELLFPARVPVLPHTKTTLSNAKKTTMILNKQQKRFVDLVRERALHPTFETIRPPIVLTGPAGTGKSHALLAAIDQVLSFSDKHRILVCAPSHTAADVMTRRLATLPSLTRETLIRIYDADRPISTVPLPLLPYCRQHEKTGTLALPTSEELLSASVIVCTCNDASLLFRCGLTNEQLRTRRRCFRTHLETRLKQCNLAGQLEGIDEAQFTHLFIDEAAQATEPETMIPFSVVVDPRPGARQVEIVLVGDPRQLSPNVFSKAAADTGLGMSMLERLLQQDINKLEGSDDMVGPNLKTMEQLLRYSFQEQLSVFLTMNYRGHPSFLFMPSVLFYHDKLMSAKSEDDGKEWCEHLRQVEKLSTQMILPDSKSLPPRLRCCKQLNWPIHFRGVFGRDASVNIKSVAGGNSWSNQLEAEAVVEILIKLTQTGVSTQSIGVMAPFRGQVALIRKLLRDQNLGGIDVGTIENYQAAERDVIVLSLTRSTLRFVEDDVMRNMGVFQQPKRANVALTRAENLFIVVGSPLVMRTDPIWRQWLWFCFRNGFWYQQDGYSCGKDILLIDSDGDKADLHYNEHTAVIGSLEKMCRTQNEFA